MAASLWDEALTPLLFLLKPDRKEVTQPLRALTHGDGDLIARTANVKYPRGNAGPWPLGTQTLIWFKPGYPGVLPKRRTSASRPPIPTWGGMTALSISPVSEASE